MANAPLVPPTVAQMAVAGARAQAGAVPKAREAPLAAPNPLRRAAVVHARTAARAAAIAMTMRSHRAPTPTWAPRAATAIQATAAQVMAAAARSPIQCAPAWTAWPNAAAGAVAVVIAVAEAPGMVAVRALAGAMVPEAPAAPAGRSTVKAYMASSGR